MILTYFSLLIPAFSLLYSPPPLTIWLHTIQDALLPHQVINIKQLYEKTEQSKAKQIKTKKNKIK